MKWAAAIGRKEGKGRAEMGRCARLGVLEKSMRAVVVVVQMAHRGGPPRESEKNSGRLTFFTIYIYIYIVGLASVPVRYSESKMDELKSKKERE